MITIIAIQKDLDIVENTLKSILEEQHVLAQSQTDESISLTTVYGWTVIVISNHLPMPALSEKLSSILNTKVITLGYSDNDGSYHYSEVVEGKVTKIYSYICNQVREKEGINLVDIYHQAITKKSFNIQPGFVPTETNLEYGSQEYFSAASEIDLLPVVYQSRSPEDKVIFLTSFPFKEYGTTPSLTWEQLL